MAQDHRSPGAEVVDVAVAVGVGEIGAFCALDKRRSAADRAEGPHGRVDAAGKEALGALLEGVGTGAGGGRGLRGHGAFSIEAARSQRRIGLAQRRRDDERSVPVWRPAARCCGIKENDAGAAKEKPSKEVDCVSPAGVLRVNEQVQHQSGGEGRVGESN